MIDLSIIVPTLNESENVKEVYKRVQGAMPENANWEIIFVDDNSKDNTVEVVRNMAQSDQRIRCLHRMGRRGLSTACIEGILSSSADFVAVMDADLQHDVTKLRDMLHELQGDENLDIVVGSRYVEGGSTGNWSNKRLSISKFATNLSRLVVPGHLQDPMSGFFMMKRDVFNEIAPNLSGLGFKILMDIFASSKRELEFKEIPYEFGLRTAGESKLDSTVALEYFQLILDKLFGRFIPVKFIIFSFIGGIGVLVHLAIFYVFMYKLHLGVVDNRFAESQTIATLLTMVFNYTLNNIITFSTNKLKGFAWLKGLLFFILICSVGAAANVGVANAIYQGEYISGWFLPVLVGILVGVVWNFAVTKTLVWSRK